MIRKTMVMMAAVLLAATAGAAQPVVAGGDCQPGRVMSARAPLFLLATAQAATVRAGPGTIAYTTTDTFALNRIQGQRFRLDAAGGAAAAGVAEMGAEVVLVPHGERCGQTWQWPEERWAEPGAQLVVDAEPRPRDAWVDGMPTFDVELSRGGYPGSDAFYEAARLESLSPAQVFAFYPVLPSRARMRAPADSLFGPLLAWAGANPSLAARFPASAALEEAYQALQPCTHPHDVHPVAGSYRVTIVAKGADTLHTYFRTDPRGDPDCGPTPPVDVAVVRPRTAGMARLYVHGHVDADLIPETNAEAGVAPGSCGLPVKLANQPRAEDGAGRAWQADFEYLNLPGCFADHPRVQQAADAVLMAYAVAEREPPPGWFRETAGGGMRFEQVWLVDGRPVLELRGERVSTRTLTGY